MLRTFWAAGLLAMRMASPSQLNQIGIRCGDPSGRTVLIQTTGSLRSNRSIRAAGLSAVVSSMPAMLAAERGPGQQTRVREPRRTFVVRPCVRFGRPALPRRQSTGSAPLFLGVLELLLLLVRDGRSRRRSRRLPAAG